MGTGLGGCWQRHGDGAAQEPAAPAAEKVKKKKKKKRCNMK